MAKSKTNTTKPKYLDVTEEVGLSKIQAGSRITYKMKDLKYIEVVGMIVDEEEPTIKTFIYYLETPGKKGDTELLKYTGTQGMFVKDVLNTHKLTIDKIYLLESSYIDLKETSITYNTSVKLKN